MSLTEAVIIGRFPGFGCADGADDFGPAQVGGVLGTGLLITRRHAEDVVKETWAESTNEINAQQRAPSSLLALCPTTVVALICGKMN